jgi:hypothetical protein
MMWILIAAAVVIALLLAGAFQKRQKERRATDVATVTFKPIATAGSRSYGPGEEEAPRFSPGDIVLTHGDSWTSRIIRWGQRLRFRGRDRKYTWWNHVAVIVREDGTLIEAIGGGVQVRKLDVYRPTEYTLVDIAATDADRGQVVRFAEECVGSPYAFIVIGSIALSLLSGSKFDFGVDGQLICSGLASRALERTQAIFARTPSHMSPADLAKYFQVEPPDDRDRGRIPDRTEGVLAPPERQAS